MTHLNILLFVYTVHTNDIDNIFKIKTSYHACKAIKLNDTTEITVLNIAYYILDSVACQEV